MSWERFGKSVKSAQNLRKIAKDVRLKPFPHEQKTYFLHAALASYVAGWDAYLNLVIKEFVQKTSNTTNIEFSFLHTILSPIVDEKLKKFNTPNWENSRELLMACTGYDPISDWPWRKAQFNRQQSQEFLNQILKVRHSFAHGFSMPTYAWTQTPSGRIQLNDKSLRKIERFFSHLVLETDIGLARYTKQNLSNRTLW
ncbi:hypothetical protein HKD27_02525 [Gluconobacter sp. R75690]|uniref:HEPN domain-containing protein n=1 Tax=unclassified Gluconobacter TaxID=2644261 RepID=UPI00188A0786|nr:hypothetical protein [Gluconobacter sp. R75690]MBF0878754.1 hypothetical protein [Gluconobacter sp. R75828]